MPLRSLGAHLLFISNEATEGMCSKCYRERQSQLQSLASAAGSPASAMAPAAASAMDAQPALQLDTTRCWKCSRNVGFTGIKCHCDYVFCGKHRQAEKHDCTYDYKAQAREHISRVNQVVRHQIEV